MPSEDIKSPHPPEMNRGPSHLRNMGALGITSTIFGAAGAVLFLWLIFANDPLGGEPHVTLKIERAPHDGQAEANAQQLKIRTSLKTKPARTEIAAVEPPVARSDRPDLSADKPNDTATDRLDIAMRPSAPLKSLIEKGPSGPLPKIGSNGRTPAKAYARRSAPEANRKSKRARIAIYISGLGLSKSATSQAITRLPGEITLAFAPYAKGLSNWRRKARQNGHEVMLQLPLEPFDYPDNDPGPYTLLTSLKAQDNARRLKWLLSRFTGYFAVSNYMGAKFTATPGAWTPVLQELAKRGLAYVEDGTSARSRTAGLARAAGLEFAKAHVVIDLDPSSESIDENLKRLETIASENGLAIGMGSGLPITLNRLAEWIGTLQQKQIDLVPLSTAIPKKSRPQARK